MPNKKRPEKLTPPLLVIAHPDSTSARAAQPRSPACGRTSEFLPRHEKLRPGLSIPTDEEWDFLYLEVTIEEPLADASRIIGPAGIASDVSAPVEQTVAAT